MKFAVCIALVGITVSHAHPWGSSEESNSTSSGRHHHHHPPPPGGPFQVIYRNLTDAQKQELESILKKDRDVIKSQLKSDLDAFKATLSTELQSILTKEKAKMDEFIKEIDEKAKTLSETAQKLYSQLKEIVENQSITFKDEHDQVKKLIKATDKTILDEFRSKRIPLPGTPPPPPPHGGPLHVIFGNLTDAQRETVHELFKNGRTQTKKEARAALDKFVATLSEDLQKAVAADKAEHEQHKSEEDAKIKTLSTAAQTLAANIKAILDDDSLTFEQDHEKISALLDAADESALDELRAAHIHLPGLHP